MPSELATMGRRSRIWPKGHPLEPVIHQVTGLSYVPAPVGQGEQVALHIVSQRTTLWRNCRLTEWPALLTDATGIVSPSTASP